MYKIVESPFINLKKNFFLISTPKSLCDQLEQDIFNFINLIRQKPSKLIKYLTNNPIFNNSDDFDSEELINFIHNLSIKNISFQPLLQKKELTKISNDLLNYILNIKATKGEIEYDLMENREINLKKRAGPNIKIKGKYYEGISLESNNLIEIISYLIKDSKGRNILFNENIKYIGIACGVINNKKDLYKFNTGNYKICSIIDLVQDFEINGDINNNSHLIEKRYEYNVKEKPIKNKSILIKSFSYDKVTKRRIKRRRYNNNFIKDNTYDNILIKNKNKYNNSPLLNEPIKEKGKEQIKSLKLFQLAKTPTNNDLNKIYKNNSFYTSKYIKIENTLNKTEEKPKEKKIIDNISEASKSPSSISGKRTKKKLKPEEKLELLRQINKESREKNSKKKPAIKIDDDSKSAVSFTTKKNNVSNDASFSEIISIDNDKKLKEKININELKSELKQELKNEVTQELKAELENKMNINNDLKIPLLKLFLNQNDVTNNNNQNNTNNNINRDTRGIENYASTNRSINSIDIFLPPNKNISAINDNDKDTIPGLININSNILNNDNNINNNNSDINKKENVIIKKFVKLNGIKNLNKVNKTPDNTSGRTRSFINNKSPQKIRKQNFVYHKIPFGNKNIFCNHINKKNDVFNLKINTGQCKNDIRNIYNIKSPTNKLNYYNNSPRPIHKESLLTFKKIIKFPKKIINNLNYIDNNRIIINNKTKNIVYIKQTSPNKMKTYDINNIYKKK